MQNVIWKPVAISSIIMTIISVKCKLEGKNNYVTRKIDS